MKSKYNMHMNNIETIEALNSVITEADIIYQSAMDTIKDIEKNKARFLRVIKNCMEIREEAVLKIKMIQGK